MSFTCSRPFSITVKQPFRLGAYWPFEEVYGANFNPAFWTDKVQGILVTGFENDSFASGFIGRGRRITNWTVSYDTRLAYSGTDYGFSTWFWMRKVGAGEPFLQLTYQSYLDPSSPSHFLYLTWLPLMPQLRVHLDTYLNDLDPGESADLTTAAPAWVPDWTSQDWVFCCITYTQADGKLRFYDGVSPVIVSAASATMHPVANGRIGLFQSGGTSSAAADELGLSVKDVLTPAQVAAVYNAGAGITWPDVNNL